MATAHLPLVLVFGGTGKTASSIIPGLIESKKFRVAATVRASSLDKPAVAEYRTKGVDIRVADIDDGVNALMTVLEGVDVLISTVYGLKLFEQRDLFAAAKRAGVKRSIPCDFATPGAKGVRLLHDQKLVIREYIQTLGIGYTFIDVGFWYQISLPAPYGSDYPFAERTRAIYGDGSKKVLVTNLSKVGKHVARVIADERTLNHAVIIWEDEVTGLQIKEIALTALRDEYTRIGDTTSFINAAAYEYMYSHHILGENSLENAVALGYLDYHELFPDVKPQTLEGWAPTFYGK